jgi:hypothetical protein
MVEREMLSTSSANKTTPNTKNPEDLVNSKGEPWHVGEKPYDRRTGNPVTTCLGDVVKMLPTPTASLANPPSETWDDSKPWWKQSRASRNLAALAEHPERLWATPQAFDANDIQRSQEALDRAKERGGCRNLREEVTMFPTPTVNDSKNNGSESRQNRNTPPHSAAVKNWPTPKARDYRSPRGDAGLNRDSPDLNVVAFNKEKLPTVGQLSADWVSLLMGYPKTYTVVEGWTKPKKESKKKK